MSIDFPSSPTVGDVFSAGGCSWRWSGTKWVANVSSTGSGGSTTTISDTPPASPSVGSGWFDSSDGNLFLWYVDPAGPGQWVPATNVPGPVGPAGPIGPTGPVGVRSYLHNGQFNIAQRGNGPFTSSVIYTLDRWLGFILNGDAASFTRVTLSDTDRTQIGDEAAINSLQNVFTGSSAAAAQNRIVQRIEDLRRLAGKTVTISFYAKCAAGALKLGVSLYQYMGTGGSPSADVVLNGQSVTLSTSFARYSITFTLGGLSGRTLGTNGDHFTQMQIWYSSGATANVETGSVGVQSGTIQLWGVQLELGSTATTLEKPDPRFDLANCQRFYERFVFPNGGVIGVGSAGTSISPPIPQQVVVYFHTTKRATPTITTSAVSTFLVAGMTATAASFTATTDSLSGSFTASGGSVGNWACVPVTSVGGYIEAAADL